MNAAMTKIMLSNILRYAKLAAEETRTGIATRTEEKRQLLEKIELRPDQIIDVAFAVAMKQMRV